MHYIIYSFKKMYIGYLSLNNKPCGKINSDLLKRTVNKTNDADFLIMHHKLSDASPQASIYSELNYISK